MKWRKFPDEIPPETLECYGLFYMKEKNRIFRSSVLWNGDKWVGFQEGITLHEQPEKLLYLELPKISKKELNWLCNTFREKNKDEE